MHAVCVRCGGPAHYSQRVSGGNSQIEVGDISYEARCRQCFEPYRAAPADSNVTQIKTAVGALNTVPGDD
jgi:thymidine kinase